MTRGPLPLRAEWKKCTGRRWSSMDPAASRGLGGVKVNPIGRRAPKDYGRPWPSAGPWCRRGGRDARRAGRRRHRDSRGSTQVGATELNSTANPKGRAGWESTRGVQRHNARSTDPGIGMVKQMATDPTGSPSGVLADATAAPATPSENATTVAANAPAILRVIISINSSSTELRETFFLQR